MKNAYKHIILNNVKGQKDTINQLLPFHFFHDIPTLVAKKSTGFYLSTWRNQS